MRLQRYLANYGNLKTGMMYLAFLLLALPLTFSCSGNGQETANSEGKPKAKTSWHEPVAFSVFVAESHAGTPEIMIEIEPDERPRLLCSNRTAMRFTQPRGAGPYEELITRARDFWTASEEGARPVDHAAPGYMSAAAFLTTNKAYLALAVQEIDKALVPDGGFMTESALESVTWAAVGADTIGLQMSDLDKEMLFEAARSSIGNRLLLTLKETFLNGKALIKPEHVFENDGKIASAYSAAFLWELNLTDSPEQWKNLLMQAHPVLTILQEGLAEGIEDADFAFIEGPVDNGLYLAIIVWERMAGSELLDRGLLRKTLDSALDYSRNGFEVDGVAYVSTVEGKATVMHLVKWRSMLSEQERKELDSWVGPADYSSEALMYLFFKPLGE
jgi:hypothetical protein